MQAHTHMHAHLFSLSFTLSLELSIISNSSSPSMVSPFPSSHFFIIPSSPSAPLSGVLHSSYIFFTISLDPRYSAVCREITKAITRTTSGSACVTSAGVCVYVCVVMYETLPPNSESQGFQCKNKKMVWSFVCISCIERGCQRRELKKGPCFLIRSLDKTW